jgi:hypothetical protein
VFDKDECLIFLLSLTRCQNFIHLLIV